MPTEAKSVREDLPVVKDHNGCWIWTKGIHKTGYGIWGPRRPGTGLAHRAVWLALRGPIPPGLQLDHLCRVKACVNPDHLRVTDCRTNVLSGVGLTAQNARKRVCKRGHPFNEKNTRRTRKGRDCRTCHTERMRRIREAANG